jgi:hypothetical protein
LGARSYDDLRKGVTRRSERLTPFGDMGKVPTRRTKTTAAKKKPGSGPPPTTPPNVGRKKKKR